jgi:hypothetical protein
VWSCEQNFSAKDQGRCDQVCSNFPTPWCTLLRYQVGGISLCAQTWHLRLVGWWVESAVRQIYAFSEKCYCGVDLFLKFLHLPHSVSKLYAHSVLYVLCIWVPVISWMSQMGLSVHVRFSANYSYFCLILLNALMLFPSLICFSRQEGVCKLDVALVVCPRRWFFWFAWMWVLPVCSLYSPLLGALVYLWLAGFHDLMLQGKLYWHNKL